MSLLFAHGERPGAAGIRGLIARGAGFSLVPSGDGDAADTSWLELLVNGLSFDLQRLAPGAPRALPDFMYLFDLPAGLDIAGCEAVTLEPGPHLEGGENLLPVVRSQMALGLELCALPGVVAVGWEPARALSSPAHFCRSVIRWLGGGVFPGLGLAALAERRGGGMRSEGLGFFTGQELDIVPDLAGELAGEAGAGDRAAAARLALRLMHELVEAGGLDAAQTVTGPDGGQLLLEPVEQGRLVRVSRA